VFICRDAYKAPLTPNYDGPDKVISKTAKYFIVQIGLREESVSIDRLKPAYLDRSEGVVVAQPLRRGRPPLRPLPPPAVVQQPLRLDFPDLPAPAQLRAGTPTPVPPPVTTTPTPTQAAAPLLRATCSGRQVRHPARYMA
jgi:hypothetical protein